VLAVFAWTAQRPAAAGVRIIAVTALITIAPWAVRNAIATGGPWTIADAGWGTNLLIGTIDLQSGANRWMQIQSALSGLDGEADRPGLKRQRRRAR
jgi:hypothetical protein